MTKHVGREQQALVDEQPKPPLKAAALEGERSLRVPVHRVKIASATAANRDKDNAASHDAPATA